MEIDPNNPVVRLCIQGVTALSPEEAQSCFQQAWKTANSDYEACIAAHYLAKHAIDEEQELLWNLEAVKRAEMTTEKLSTALLPSLYLNLGYSYEKQKDLLLAEHYYELASSKMENLPLSGYLQWVANGINEGKKRTALHFSNNSHDQSC